VLSIVVFTVVYTFIALPATGPWPQGVGALQVLPIALVGSMFGTLLALVLVAFANNKVEGLALMKGFGRLRPTGWPQPEVIPGSLSVWGPSITWSCWQP